MGCKMCGIMTNPSVALLSDQTLFRRGLAALLRASGFERVSEYASSAELIHAARTRPPDVVIVDLDHEREDTMSRVRALRHELLDTHIVVIGTAIRQGAADASFDSEIETPQADLPALVAAADLHARHRHRSVEALRQHRLWERMTTRQRDVMRWLATGMENRAIARKLRIGERAVKAHLSALLALFGVHNRTQLALIADRAGVRPPLSLRG
jgi:DNA-binding NarL/FixJ family response regulator